MIYRNSQVPSGHNMRQFVRDHFFVDPPEREEARVHIPMIAHTPISQDRGIKNPDRFLAGVQQGGSIDLECPVCMEQAMDARDLRKLSCKHVFCYTCIKRWLAVKGECPLCKRDCMPIGSL